MNIKYSKLGTINIKHPYFKDGMLKDFQLLPLFNTAALLNNNSIRTRPLNNEGKFELYIDESKIAQLSKDWHDTPLNLFFALFIQDPYFLSYTDLSLNPSLIPPSITINAAREYYFFSNTLSALDENSFTSDTNKVLLLPAYFDISFYPSEITIDGISIRKANHTASIIGVPVVARENDITLQQIDLQSADQPLQKEELYEIVIGDLDPIPFKYFNYPLSNNPFGVLQLTLGGNDDNGSVVNNEQNESAYPAWSYFINFKARAIKWQYNIIARQHKVEDYDILIMDINKPGISHTDLLNNLSTSPPDTIPPQRKEEKTLPNGQKAISILLEKSIPLLEQPDKAYILRINKGNEQPNYIILPVASKNAQLEPLSENEHEGYLTNIYVYL